MARRSLFSQMASLGEDALGRLAQNPRTNRMVQSALELKDRVDDLARRVRGLEAMEQRLERVEQRLDKIEGGGTIPEAATSDSAATTTKSSGA
jgi:ubiquinone biosynthesis protein UbiJ